MKRERARQTLAARLERPELMERRSPRAASGAAPASSGIESPFAPHCPPAFGEGTSHRLIVDDFSDLATELRACFDKRMGGSLRTNPPPRDRFVWDYWHVPGQYTYHRTPAADFYEKPLITAFYKQLVQWGQQALGVSSSGGFWLSYYVHGGRQEIHHDKGNGEWAFVYSLTHWEKRAFSGGETFLARPELRPYWRWSEFEKERAESSFEIIEPRFGRLLLFDSRVPHGVRPIEGTFDPMEGRLVIHGWLKASGVQVKGALRPEQALQVIEDYTGELVSLVNRFQGLEGLVTAHLEVAESGQVERVRFLSNTLQATEPDATPPRLLLEALVHLLRELSFAPADGRSSVTLPIDLF